MKAKKAILALGCAALLVTGSVLGTLAYLTSTTETVTNTFTVGNVKITLDEAKVNAAGQLLDKEGEVYTEAEGQELADRVAENDYHLLPAHNYVKDPIVHVDATSEDSWLFVKVVNEIEDIEAKDGTVASQMTANGWTPVAGATGVYSYKEIVNANDNIDVFDEFTISGTVDNETLAVYAQKKITIDAYAIQADGFATAAEAWEAAPGWN